MKALLWNC